MCFFCVIASRLVGVFLIWAGHVVLTRVCVLVVEPLVARIAFRFMCAISFPEPSGSVHRRLHV